MGRLAADPARVLGAPVGAGLAWFYVTVNAATATVCGALMPDWGQLAVPFALYTASVAVAIMVLRRLAAHRVLLSRPGRLEPSGHS